MTASTGERAASGGSVVTDVLTARLSNDPRWQIVERSRLTELENELALSAGGFTDAASAVRQGRLVHADVVLVCRVRAVGDNGGEVQINAIDAFRAEVLGSQTIPLGQRPNGAWLRSPPEADLGLITKASVDVLADAAARLAQVSAWPVVFPIFFRNYGSPSQSAAFSRSLMDTLETEAAAEHVRLLHRQSFGGVHNEGLLSTAGMTDFSAGSWLRVADLFVWCEFTENGLAGATANNSVTLRVWAWAGAGEPRSQALMGTAANLKSIAKGACDFILGELAQRAKPTPEARRLVAKSLISEASKIGSPDLRTWPLPADVLIKISRLIQLVDAAAFFVPEDQEIQELRFKLLMDAATTEEERGEVAADYRRFALACWRKAGGKLDLGLIDRSYESWGTHSNEKLAMIREVGLALRGVPPEEIKPWNMLYEAFFMNLYFMKGDPDAVTALEAIWPSMRVVMAYEFDPNLEHPKYGWRFYIPEFYPNDRARGRALLTGSLKSDAEPAQTGQPLTVMSSSDPWSMLQQPQGRIFLSSPPRVSQVPVVARAVKTDEPQKPARAGPMATSPVSPDASSGNPEDPVPPAGSIVADGDHTWYVKAIVAATDPASEAMTVKLCDQIARGTVEEFRRMIAAGADPVALGDWRGPALAFATFSHKWDFVDAVLEHPVDLSRKMATIYGESMTVGGYTLYYALARNRPDLARRMLDAGVRVQDAPYGAWGPILKVSLAERDIELTKRLIVLGAKPGLNEGLLDRCVEVRNLEALRLLIPYSKAYDLPPGQWDASREVSMALLNAVKAKWKEGVQVLVDAGGSTEAKDRDGITLQEHASANPEIAAIVNHRPFSPDNQSGGAEAVAAVTRNDPALKSWPINDAVLRYVDARGWTVLHHACNQKQVSLALRLVAAGAPLNVLTKSGQSPLTFAVGTGNEDLVAALLAAGANVNLKGDGDKAMSPLFFAAQNGSLPIVRLLLRSGADPRQRSLDVRATALLVATHQPQCFEVLKALVTAGASYQEADGEGFGALEYAIFSDDPAVIQFLIDRGVKWRPSTLYPNYNPLVQAARNGKRASVRKLLELGIYDNRALAEAKDPVVRELLEDGARPKGDRVADDEELWPAICGDLQKGWMRAEEHIKRGGNGNYRSQTWTPLLLALRSCNVTLVRCLLSHGADPKTYPIQFKVSPYSELIGGGPKEDNGKENVRDEDVAECSRLLMQANAGLPWDEEVMIAAWNGWAKTVAVFLDAGVSREAVLKDFERYSIPILRDKKRAQVLRLIQQ